VKANGAVPAVPAREVRWVSMPSPGGGKIVFTTVGGEYLGALVYECIDAQALLIMANQLRELAAATAGSVQIASPLMVPP